MKFPKFHFQVNKADGDVYVLLAGSSEDSSEDTQDSSEDAQTGEENTSEDASGNDSQVADEQTESDGSDGSDDSSDSSSQEENHICTISIECSSILDNWDDLKSSKAEFVPSDGWILYTSEISFTPGDTVLMC